MPQIKHNNRPKVIRTRSGLISHRPQRLGIMEDQEQSGAHLTVSNVCGCLYSEMWFQTAVKEEEKQSQHGKITMQYYDDAITGGIIHHVAHHPIKYLTIFPYIWCPQLV